nr:f-box protein [Quercus suber]
MSDLTLSEPQSHIDHFDRLPDSILLLIFNRIGDVKALGRCCVVSRCFHSLVPQVDNVVVRVDCVISDDDSSSSSLSSPAISSSSNKSRNPFSNLFRFVFGAIVSGNCQFTLHPKIRGVKRELGMTGWAGEAINSSVKVKL